MVSITIEHSKMSKYNNYRTTERLFRFLRKDGNVGMSLDQYIESISKKLHNCKDKSLLDVIDKLLDECG